MPDCEEVYSVWVDLESNAFFHSHKIYVNKCEKVYTARVCLVHWSRI